MITDEPGIYLPGIGGVRIEDDLLITEDGNRVLTRSPKRIDHLIVSSIEEVSVKISVHRLCYRKSLDLMIHYRRTFKL